MIRRLPASLAVLSLLALPVSGVAAPGQGPRSEAPGAAEAEPASTRVEQDVVAGGTHWRLSTPGGAVHVWRPAGYRHADAGTVVYLHGYYTDADQAWEQHRLADQFDRSRRNALFIAAESPINNPDTVKWRDPASLLATVRELAGIAVPDRLVVAMGHSGGFRTIVPWLTSSLLDEVVLLDGLYNNLPDFQAWIAATEHARRIVLVGFETAERTEQFLTGVPGALVRDRIPETYSEVSRREREARVLYLRSQYGHMELVTEGRVIPLVLRLTGLKPL